MKLAVWLKKNAISRVDFARRIGVSPGAITQMCNNEAAWLSRETAETIARETKGAVTPNDFLPFTENNTKRNTMPHSVTEAIEAFAKGEIVIVTDDDDRENEGDLICAAIHCTPEKMAFIIRNTCGIVCAPLSSDTAKRLHLTPMVASNDAPLGTAFTVTVDVKHGLTTGISAEQRSNTVRALANGNMGADEFRDYILGFIFYKYRSEKIERFADAQLEQEDLKFADLKENTPDGESYISALEEASVEELGYFLKPSETFHAIALKGSNQLDTEGAGDGHNFILGDLTKILKNIEQSTLGTDSADDFVNLFEDLDLTSSKLG